MKQHTIYLASSWRNIYQPDVLEMLRAAGHEVYDFRNPAPNDRGFSWRQIFPEPPETWSAAKLAEALRHPVAVRGHGFDQAGMDRATACVLLLPCGSSAHLEAGWCSGRGKPTVAYAPAEIREPELMYKTFEIDAEGPPVITEEAALLAWLDNNLPTDELEQQHRVIVDKMFCAEVERRRR